MNYAGIIKNDISAGEGVCVTFFTQGCPYHCQGCHNPETWDFNGGKEFTVDVLNNVLDAINANGIQRNFCLMGGEPLCKENAFLSYLVTLNVRQAYPNIKIYIWSGNTFENLIRESNPFVGKTLALADYLIDGPYMQSLRDITLNMRGSRNQRVIDLKTQRIIEE